MAKTMQATPAMIVNDHISQRLVFHTFFEEAAIIYIRHFGYLGSRDKANDNCIGPRRSW